MQEQNVNTRIPVFGRRSDKSTAGIGGLSNEQFSGLGLEHVVLVGT